MVEMASCRIGANVPGATGVSSRRTNPKEASNGSSELLLLN